MFKIITPYDILKYVIGGNKMKKNDYFQYLRAISIIAVIVIHSLTVGDDYVLALRQFINFCVALFIFLSGYLTDTNIGSTREFYKKRILRVAIPYVIWSFVYIVIDRDFSIMSIVKKMITGQACGAYYYIIVYIQLVLLTPVCIKFIKKRKYRYLGHLTPITVIILSVFAYLKHPIPFPYNSLTFLVWFIFYFYGMQVRNYNLETKLKEDLNKNIMLYIGCVVLSILEGKLWSHIGDFSMAISQIKISSILTSICFINIAIAIQGKVVANSNVLKNIGDYSFGIYLIHLLFIKLAREVMPGYTFLTIIFVVVCCYIAIDLSYKLFGEKVCMYLGFK